MERWSRKRVEKLAPDTSSAKAGRALAHPGPWSDTGSTEALLWGKCQGSGRTPYQVSVDLTGPSFKCSCPSRKIPCKHALALLLLWTDGAVGAGEIATEPPTRSHRPNAAPKAAHARTEPSDPEAQARRREERLARMTEGLRDFETWLCDMVRHGLAATRQREASYWDDTAARLVDAQLPGLARRVRTAGADIFARDDWIDHLLTEAGRWWCAARAWRHRADLAGDDFANLRTFLGWPFATDEVRRGETATDAWIVLGRHTTAVDMVLEQRTWLQGAETGEVVVVLDFAGPGGMLGVSRIAGTVVEATLSLYPGSAPRRALLGDDVAVSATTSLPAAPDFQAELGRHAQWLAANPWAGRLPATVADVRVVRSRGLGDALVDSTGAVVRIADEATAEQLLAITGGHPVDVFGEIDGTVIRPLTVAVDDELVAL